MVQRMQFDVVFCAANLAGLNWIELFQRVRRKVGVFGLMLDAYDPEAGRIFTAVKARCSRNRSKTVI